MRVSSSQDSSGDVLEARSSSGVDTGGEKRLEGTCDVSTKLIAPRVSSRGVQLSGSLGNRLGTMKPVRTLF